MCSKKRKNSQYAFQTNIRKSQIWLFKILPKLEIPGTKTYSWCKPNQLHFINCEIDYYKDLSTIL